MDQIIALTTFNVIQSLTVVVFLTITLFASIRFLIWGDTQEKNIQKIIGGLSVFIVAIISQSPTVFVVSLFIGGLIIATEKFMQSLAAILKAEGKAIPETLKAINDANVTIATKTEVEEQKKAEEAELGKKEIYIKSENGFTPDERTRSIQAQIKERKLAENLVSKYYLGEYVNRYTSEVKLSNEYGNIVVDGVIHYSSDKDTLSLDNILGLVEIKYVPEIKSKFLLDIYVRQIVEKIRFLFISKQVLIVFVSKKIEEEVIKETSKIISEKYKTRVVLAFFRLTDNGIEPIKVPVMKDFVT